MAYQQQPPQGYYPSPYPPQAPGAMPPMAPSKDAPTYPQMETPAAGAGAYPMGAAPGTYPPGTGYMSPVYGAPPAGMQPMAYQAVSPAPGVMYQQPGAQSPGQVIIVSTTVAQSFGTVPIGTVCPNCRQQIVTKTSHKPGLLTWLLAGGLCLAGCIPCCLIPFCMESAMDVDHDCPACGTHIAHKSQL